MENKKNYTPIIIAFGIIIFVVLVGVYYIGKSSNNSPLGNSQTQDNQTAVETPTQPAQTETQTPAPAPAPVKQAPVQSLQSQCEATAQKLLDSYIPNRRVVFQSQLGSDAQIQFTHSDHYSKSDGVCYMSLHEMVLSYKFSAPLTADYYYLYKLDNGGAVIGELWYTTIGTKQTISQCEVNTLPCSSTDVYASMTAPYLNN